MSTKSAVSKASVLALAVTVSATSTPGKSPEDVKDKSHHKKNGTGFTNPWDSYREFPVLRALKVLSWGRVTGEWTLPDTSKSTLKGLAPKFLPTRSTEGFRATWLGHACYHVEFPSGLRVLFDPVFEERCSPLSFYGPQRYAKQPCRVEEIPFIDAVFISHNHYDHLSYPTVTEIAKRHPSAHFFVPKGNRKWFLSCSIKPENVTELDWWEERDLLLNPIKEASSSDPKTISSPISARISCLPSQHQSGRRGIDRCKTLWSSWGISSGDKSVFFAGDTGYRSVPLLPDNVDDHDSTHNYPICPAFKQIGQFRGPFDLGLIPIGAYKPRDLMSPVHSDSFDAVEIFKDTKCKRAMAIHWGTWTLTTEEVMEPPMLLRKALKRSDLPEEGVFDVCDIGESRVF